MSVEPSELMSEVWTRWQGHLVNGVFPLGRYLGCSDHSGVFLTQSPAHGAELAIKLVPTNRNLAEAQLPRWKRAGGLAHPHLLRLLEWGGCQLDGLPYLYTVMEYADQTLAQLLASRALTADEARQMLLPTLDALAFLHGRNLVQGQLKPANILVVGDQLKLASDTIRRASESRLSNHVPSVYDAPEERQGNISPAGDVWALGVTLLEALTRQRTLVVPADFPAPLREVVTACVSPAPHDRPSVTDLMVLAGAKASGAVAGEPRAPKPAAPAAASAASAAVAAGAVRPAARASESALPRRRAVLLVLVAAAVILALIWAGVRLLKAHHGGATPLAEAPAAAAPRSGTAAPLAQPQAPRSPAPADTGGSEASASAAAMHEVIPDVPRSARRTIRGHINVWVRVIIDQHGAVIAASADRNGPSRYFQRLALDAARQWTFPPAATSAQRLMQIRFDFNRDATTARAVALH
jgi:TonB family protein